MKIIHIVENLDIGAVENWLVKVFLTSRAIRPTWEWSFYCILNLPGRLDDTVKNAGGLIYYSPVSISHKLAFLNHLRSVLKRGNYDIIHSHHDLLSGFYLLASWGIHFNQRILHIHNNDNALPVGSSLLKKLLLKPFKWLGYYFSDTIIGISKYTLQEYLGNIDKSGLSNKVLYYGIDMSSFRLNPSRSIRSELNISEEARVILFVGRMNEDKNPLFVLDILSEVYKKRKDVYALFIGKGELEQKLIDKTKILGLEHLTRVLGWRDDIAMIMKQADIFIFPRLEFPKEGLGLVVVEAQTAGLPIMTTNGIVDDAIVIPEFVDILPLKDNAREWADQIIEKLTHKCTLSRADALSIMEASDFELSRATQHLIDLYESTSTSN